jgi:hypothetical protein
MHDIITKKDLTRTVAGRTVLNNSSDALERNCNNFIPWRVEFLWIGSDLDIAATRAVFYVRSANPGLAGSYAMKLWQHWMRKGMTVFDKFPKLDEDCQVERITDTDFAIEYERARRFDPDILIAGDIKNPRVFWPRTLSKTAITL